MNPLWRNLVVTILVGVAAGTVGGWMGAQRARSDEGQYLPLRQSVKEIVREGLDLTNQQRRQIQDIEDRFYQRRGLLRVRISEANMELADALLTEMVFGRQAHEAVNHLQEGLGDLQRATVSYVIDVRDVLTPDQQRIYDRKVRDALTAPES